MSPTTVPSPATRGKAVAFLYQIEHAEQLESLRRLSTRAFEEIAGHRRSIKRLEVFLSEIRARARGLEAAQ